MARMSARCIFCVFAPLAFLSGCQQIPYFGGPAHIEAKKTDPIAVAQSADAQPSPNVLTEVKSPPAPQPQVETRSSDPVFDPALLKSGKRAEGVPGVVLLEDPSPSAPPPAPGPAAQAIKKDGDYAPVVKAFQYMLDKKPREALQELQVYDKSTQEFFLNWMPAAVIILHRPMDQMSAPEIDMLNELFSRWSQTIRNHTKLVISNMCYCRNVQGFGAYEPLPPNHAFLSATAGRAGELVQVYVELKNFVSEPVKEGEYVTKLACSLEIKDSSGKRVHFWQFSRDETTYQCRSRLNDLHKNLSINVPAMPPGTYLLTIQVVDETLPSHRRVAQQSLPFRVTPVATDDPQR
jgi:hypothetical protein